MVYIKNGNVISGDDVAEGVSIEVSGTRISAIGKKIKIRQGSFVIDARGCFVSPGFIDCHVHGEPEKILFNEARHGTTSFVIAESCAPINFIYKRVERIKEFTRSNPMGENLLGFRLEGPYISKVRAGAQNPSYIRKPDVKELSSIIAGCYPFLKIMTIAPELKDVQPLIRLLVKNRVIASIGHSDATYEKALEGIDAGISHSTHTFNAMSPIDRREPGVTGAVLSDDRVTAEIILDMIHVHKALFNLLLKAKKKERVIMVSDSLISDPPKNSVRTGSAYRFADGKLAGSSLTMIAALKNAVVACGVPLLDALRLITTNPARLMGVENKKGSLTPGKDADIVVFDRNFEVKATLVRGKIMYEKKGSACAA